MSMRGRRSGAQVRAVSFAVQRRNYGMDKDALARPDDWWYSWSARMPAYYGTELQAKHGGKEHGC